MWETLAGSARVRLITEHAAVEGSTRPLGPGERVVDLLNGPEPTVLLRVSGIWDRHETDAASLVRAGGALRLRKEAILAAVVLEREPAAGPGRTGWRRMAAVPCWIDLGTLAMRGVAHTPPGVPLAFTLDFDQRVFLPVTAALVSWSDSARRDEHALVVVNRTRVRDWLMLDPQPALPGRGRPYLRPVPPRSPQGLPAA